MVTTLDKSKALDKVKWGFIQRVMERLGFNARWINLIMQCISVMTIVKLGDCLLGTRISDTASKQVMCSKV